jgi:hypothetical protein
MNSFKNPDIEFNFMFSGRLFLERDLPFILASEGLIHSTTLMTFVTCLFPSKLQGPGMHRKCWLSTCHMLRRKCKFSHCGHTKKILLKKYKNNYGVSKETTTEGRKTFMKCTLDS